CPAAWRYLRHIRAHGLTAGGSAVGLSASASDLDGAGKAWRRGKQNPSSHLYSRDQAADIPALLRQGQRGWLEDRQDRNLAHAECRGSQGHGGDLEGRVEPLEPH